MKQAVKNSLLLALQGLVSFAQALVYCLIINSVIATILLEMAHSLGQMSETRLVFEIPTLWQLSFLMAIGYAVTKSMSVARGIAAHIRQSAFPRIA